MPDFFYQAHVGQALDFLWSGDPPVIARLLGANAIVVMFYAIRKAITPAPMSGTMMLVFQLGFLIANCYVLFQSEVDMWFRSLSLGA